MTDNTIDKKALKIAARAKMSNAIREALGKMGKECSNNNEQQQNFNQLPARHPFKDHVTFAEKTAIKRDWCALLPDMGYRKKRMGLGRVVGPLYIGISLRVKTFLGADYHVEQSVHNLAYREDFAVAGLSFNPYPATIEFHEHKELYPQSVAYLKEHISLLEGPVTLQDIFDAYKNSHSLGHHEAGTPAVIAAWAGEPQKAKEYLDWGYTHHIEKDDFFKGKVPEYAREWLNNYNVLNRELSYDLPGKDFWLQYHKDMINNPEILREITRQEAVKFQLEYAPYQDIAGVPYKEGSLIKDQKVKKRKSVKKT